MARVGISITKTMNFRGAPQEFSNVYYYDGLSGTPTETEGNALIDELVTKEKTIHSSLVTFVRGRIWLQAGSAAANVMISQKNVSGVGSKAGVPYFDRERAFLFRLRAGSDSRGKPVYLRKWYHSFGALSASVTVSQNILENGTAFTSSERASLVAALPAIGTCGSGGTLGTLCSKNGRVSTAGATWEAHPYLEHRQLGDMWRG